MAFDPLTARANEQATQTRRYSGAGVPTPETPSVTSSTPASAPNTAKAPTVISPVVQTYDAVRSEAPEGYDARGYDARGYTAQTGRAVTADAVLRGVDPAALVENRILGIIDSDSPLMQRAKSEAAARAAAGGWGNSGMAISAGQRAVIDTATPIATADAATIDRKNQDNQRWSNEAEIQNTIEQNAMTRWNVGEVNTASRSNMEAANKASEFGATAQNRAAEFGADARNTARTAYALAQNTAKAAGTLAQNNANDRFATDTNYANRMVTELNFNGQEAATARDVQQQIANSASLSGVGESLSNEISAIENSTLSVEDKKAAVLNAIERARMQADIIKDVDGLNINDILNGIDTGETDVGDPAQPPPPLRSPQSPRPGYDGLQGGNY